MLNLFHHYYICTCSRHCNNNNNKKVKDILLTWIWWIQSNDTKRCCSRETLRACLSSWPLHGTGTNVPSNSIVRLNKRTQWLYKCGKKKKKKPYNMTDCFFRMAKGNIFTTRGVTGLMYVIYVLMSHALELKVKPDVSYYVSVVTWPQRPTCANWC